MIAQIDRDGNGKISIEGKDKISMTVNYFFYLEFAALIERQSTSSETHQ
jgi:hypothetical protein